MSHRWPTAAESHTHDGPPVGHDVLNVLNSNKMPKFTNERVQYNVLLFDMNPKGPKSLKILKISLTFCFDNL